MDNKAELNQEKKHVGYWVAVICMITRGCRENVTRKPKQWKWAWRQKWCFEAFHPTIPLNQSCEMHFNHFVPVAWSIPQQDFNKHLGPSGLVCISTVTPATKHGSTRFSIGLISCLPIHLKGSGQWHVEACIPTKWCSQIKVILSSQSKR